MSAGDGTIIIDTASADPAKRPNSGCLAMLAAMRPASSRVSRLAERCAAAICPDVRSGIFVDAADDLVLGFEDHVVIGRIGNCAA